MPRGQQVWPRIAAVHRIVNHSDKFDAVLVRSPPEALLPVPMREHIEQNGLRRARSASTRPAKQTPETLGHRLLEIVVYDKCCRIGGSLRLDDLADSEIGDWTMPNYRRACRYAASQGWLVVGHDTLTLTIAGLRAA